ncbi:MAG: class I SAM-dependent methyltransferase [Burkholderiales bacterium]
MKNAPTPEPIKKAESEADAVRLRYARRDQAALDWRYHRLNPAALWPALERERALAKQLLRHVGGDITQLRRLRLLEVGCGTGGNLLDMLRLGFAPENLAGVELLPERHQVARCLLPAGVQLWLGDAMQLDVPPASMDLLLQSTVFSSLLDDAYQQRLATQMWRWLKPGGALIWYDFTMNNPRNPDVRGVPLRRVRALFPQGEFQTQRITLAPPLARWAIKLHPSLYTVLNVWPALRTHLLAWIVKPLHE